jgi:hypothetical protein
MADRTPPTGNLGKTHPCADVRDQRLDSKIFQERSILQVRRVKRVALAEIAGFVAAAEPADALFGSAVRK